MENKELSLSDDESVMEAVIEKKPKQVRKPYVKTEARILAIEKMRLAKENNASARKLIKEDEKKLGDLKKDINQKKVNKKIKETKIEIEYLQNLEESSSEDEIVEPKKKIVSKPKSKSTKKKVIVPESDSESESDSEDEPPKKPLKHTSKIKPNIFFV
jgi:hypothetical protein